MSLLLAPNSEGWSRGEYWKLLYIPYDNTFVKNSNREGLFDPRKMSSIAKENIIKKLEQLEMTIKI